VCVCVCVGVGVENSSKWQGKACLKLWQLLVDSCLICTEIKIIYKQISAQYHRGSVMGDELFLEITNI